MTTADQKSTRVPLHLYDGCYVELFDGRMKGPVFRRGTRMYPWQIENAKHDDESWTENGRAYFGVEDKSDIACVLSFDQMRQRFGLIHGADKPAAEVAIPPHVIAAAKEAGLKAVPAYDQFVEAIVRAAFHSQYSLVLDVAKDTASADIDQTFWDKATYENLINIFYFGFLDAVVTPPDLQKFAHRGVMEIANWIARHRPGTAPADKHNFENETVIPEKPEVEPDPTFPLVQHSTLMSAQDFIYHRPDGEPDVPRKIALSTWLNARGYKRISAINNVAELIELEEWIRNFEDENADPEKPKVEPSATTGFTIPLDFA